MSSTETRTCTTCGSTDIGSDEDTASWLWWCRSCKAIYVDGKQAQRQQAAWPPPREFCPHCGGEQRADSWHDEGACMPVTGDAGETP